jgi:hypothetical protein
VDLLRVSYNGLMQLTEDRVAKSRPRVERGILLYEICNDIEGGVKSLYLDRQMFRIERGVGPTLNTVCKREEP